MITTTRAIVSRRRLLFVLLLLCLLMAAFAGLHADGDDDASSVCALTGIGCALVAAIAVAVRISALFSRRGAILRSLRSLQARQRGSGPRHALGLAALCRMRI